jgi:L-cysteine S-thiosulfotransferase
MRLRKLGCAALMTACAVGALAQLRAAEIPLEQRRSAYDSMSRETRAMQDDDTANPAMLWVLDGETLWNTKAGTAQKACADCHTEDKMKGVAARYPALHAGKPVNLEQRINACRSEQQKAPPFTYESRELLALTAFVARQSRGLPIAIDESKLKPTIDQGRRIFTERQGQLRLACAQCHDDNWDRQLAGSPVGQGHPTGYPIYRLEWQGLGSLQRRLRNCIFGIRAEQYELGSPELVALEAFLMWRARGMKVETPAVRP